MAGDKFLRNVASTKTEVRGTQVGGGGAADGIVALDASGLLALSMFPVGIGSVVVNMTADSNVTAGDWVNIFDNSGVVCRPANATDNTKPCHGFVLSTVTATNPVDVFFEGINTAVSGKTPGNTLFLTTIDGADSVTAPGTAGNIVQHIGVVVTATSVYFRSNLDFIELVA